MGIIHTNPYGFRIHSPYVYHLVARVLYGKKFLTPHQRAWLGTLKRRERNDTEKLLRLLLFFKPDHLRWQEEEPLLRRIIDAMGPSVAGGMDGGDTGEAQPYPHGGAGERDCREMIVGSLPAHFPPELPEGKEPDCWILLQLRHLEMTDFFNTLRQSTKTTITIEVNNTGIVIFNPKFRKQNYFVREWFLI